MDTAANVTNITVSLAAGFQLGRAPGPIATTVSTSTLTTPAAGGTTTGSASIGSVADPNSGNARITPNWLSNGQGGCGDRTSPTAYGSSSWRQYPDSATGHAARSTVDNDQPMVPVQPQGIAAP
jgi:hypothetical protein